MQIYKTGKLPAEPIGTKIRFGDIFVNLPRPPMVFGHQDLMGSEPWHMLGNDEVGNCVFAAAAHDLYLWSLIGHGPRVRITTLDTFSDYHAVTGFIPGYPSTDRGTKMADAVEYYRKTGIRDAEGKRHPITAYVALTPGNLDQLATAVHLFGAVDIGVEINMEAQSQQFIKGIPWHNTEWRPNGGHCISVVGRDGNGNFLCVTWGKLHPVEPSFIANNMDEGYAYLSPHITAVDNLTPENFNRAELQKMLAQLASYRAAEAKEKSERPQCYVTATSLRPTKAQCDAAFEVLRYDINAAGFGYMISDADLRPFSDAVALAVVTAV